MLFAGCMNVAIWHLTSRAGLTVLAFPRGLESCGAVMMVKHYVEADN